MAIQVNIHEAKTHLSRLLQQVENGEEIILARGGRPIARIIPMKAGASLDWIGRDAGKIWMSDDFDAPLADDITEDFYR